jgi:hypothetical protein
MEHERVYEYDYCFVTAFYDIGRKNWEHYKRSEDEYIGVFCNLVQMKIPLVVFIDQKYYERIKTACDELRPANLYTKIIPVDDAFLRTNIKSWSYVERERNIMNSELYKRVISHRKSCPETHIPEYTCINHAKVDFVKYAIEHIVDGDGDIKYVGWVDFGYIQKLTNMPSDRVFVYDKLKNDQVNMIFNNDVDESDSDPYFTLLFAPEKITGGFWFGSKTAFLKYWEKYHATVQKLHNIGIADDDQAIVLNIFTRQYDDLIKIWKNTLLYTHGWCVGFILFRNEV